MTMAPLRVCIIGNSHLGALKEAWDEIGNAHEQIEITFFAARGNRLEDLEVDGNALRAGGPDADNLSKFLAFTSGGSERIVGDAYDLFVVYGGNLAFVNLPLVYSQAVLRLCVSERSLESLHFDITTKLRGITDRSILVAGNPLRSNWPDDRPTYPYDTVLDIFREVYAPFDAPFIPQPEETRDAQNRTLPEFATGSRQLDVGRAVRAKGTQDKSHMNAAYGRIWLQEFIASLSAGFAKKV